MTIASTPAPPYYAVIFTSTRTDEDVGYAAMAALMVEMAAKQPGHLGHESVRDHGAEGRPGITVSYWRDLDSMRAWKEQVTHAAAQRLGRERWYSAYRVRIARVEREYGSADGL